jgi:N-dimethylarginine dimethylaminohydrolase
MQPTFVMCRPDHFNVSYVINPWMEPAAWEADHRRLAAASSAGWEMLVEALRTRGARVELVPAVTGLPDLVFTANAAVVLDGVALMARFRHQERRGEEPHNHHFFTSLHNRDLLRSVHPMPEGVPLEGAGDCVWDAARHCFWLGYGQRSDARAAATVSRVFDADVVPLELVNPRFYHMDTALVPLSYGDALAVRSAFSDDGWRVIRGRVGRDNLIEVPAEDAAMLAANVVCIGNEVLMGRCSAPLEAQLEARGYRVVRLPLETFNMSGGSAFCLTLRLDRLSCPRPSAARAVREPFGFSAVRA